MLDTVKSNVNNGFHHSQEKEVLRMKLIPKFVLLRVYILFETRNLILIKAHAPLISLSTVKLAWIKENEENS